MTLSRQTRARLAWVKSFLNPRRSFQDYPVDYVDQGEQALDLSGRLKHQRWRADLLGAMHLSGLGDSQQAALEDAKSKFAAAVATGQELPRPGSRPKITFASDEQVSRFPELRDHFIKEILGVEWAWLTDESSLWDFHTSNDNTEMYSEIGDVYGVDVSQIPNANIGAILASIMSSIGTFPEDNLTRALRLGHDATSHSRHESHVL